MICGVDEAGKGPVIGPLVVAAVKVNNAKDIENLGFKDSKQLSKKKRKDIPFHIAKKFKQFDSIEGYKFWARDESDAKLFCEKMDWAIGSLKEVKE